MHHSNKSALYCTSTYVE